MIAKLLIFMILALSVAAVKVCHEHEDCPKSQFCFFPAQSCAPCVDCALYRRRERSVASCCKDPKECGQCLDGFTDELLSDGSVRPLCVPLKPRHPLTTVPISAPENVMAMDEWPLCALGIAGILVSIAFGIGFVTKTPLLVKVRSRGMHHAECEPVPANLYAPSAPAPPSYCTAKVSEEILQLNYTSCEFLHESKQQASKYLEPQYVTPPSSATSEPGETSTDVVDSSTPGHSSENFLLDENTLPSNWSPGPNYSEQHEGFSQLPTSFEGVLRLNSVTNAQPVSPPSNTAQNPFH